jgi:Mg-chelatase subunit ChlD
MSTEFKPAGGVKLPRVFNQLGIFVLDGSGSMSENTTGNHPKAKEVELACFELFNRMNASRVKQNFSFACIKFDNTPTTILSPIQFDFNTLMNTNFDPLDGKGGQTYINLALERAKEMAEDFLNSASVESVPHKVLILLMSDGMCFEPDKTLQISSEIKSNPKIEIASVYFGTVGGNDVNAQNLMKDVASDTTRFSTVYDGEALRSFFERSISQSANIKIE